MFNSKTFVCPNFQCRKIFQKPLMLTDSSKIPRETYYACPHCLSKMNVTVDKTKIVHLSVKTSEKKELEEPEECPYHLGYLKKLPKGNSIPDECFTCVDLIRCSA